ncbi:hypothetical protein CE91St62_39130 [Lachnospiraceae bacterium]|uniref:VaFE repeat-containing surface-anchored protein n=1 Tax=Extibacter sp. GGCC_0201 TaxID=2731209 RepID=UPI001AA13369|nr:VaFE repeat-containing surface-anchored protein [Extibacter sp. GGCC_0201]MBO1720724.1 VaFE repeat-containing surface-anchored protein [Extibacter sp. GGCC_0201]BDF35851.1 hypothetical protein CE91St61_39260 [Lachnospiraceae bacterium]BDF39852.1 hypothetical protein CE91St62_39130 [Lachnospiraceae bacterium]
MLQKLKNQCNRLLAFMLAAIVMCGSLAANYVPAYAADGTLHFNSGETLSYGSYFTTRMTFDGSNTAYCVEPLKYTPAAGDYSYDLLPANSPVRKALFYLPGGYGYEKSIKNSYLSGWSDDNAYVIGHLVAAYTYANYNDNSGAFHGATQEYINKAKEITNAIQSLPNPPKSFKAFIIPKEDSQTLAGSWYQVPNGWIELQKSSSNPALSEANKNYSLAGAQYGIYLGDKLVETLTTDKNGYAKSGELEEASYTLKELKSPSGFTVDSQAHKVSVEAEKTNTVKVSDKPKYNPVDLVLQKLDLETSTNTPQGAASLQGAEFTFKFYTQQSDTDPAAAGNTPVRTWVLKTDSNGEIHFTKDYKVSGDDFYYADNKVCIPLGTVTVVEEKGPAGYLKSDEVWVQKITGEGDAETISTYNSPTVKEQVIRGGVKVQKRDYETGLAEAQGAATLESAKFTVTTLNDNPVLVDGNTYTKDQVVLTLTTDQAGLASTAKDALPYGHFRIDEIKAPDGYLNTGKISIEFDVTEDGKIVELMDEEHSIENQVIRGDLELVKISDGSQKRLANVPFKITSQTTGENHVIVTDKNGYASTSADWNKHTFQTNRGESSKDGIWFGTSEPNDEKGALIYDTYTIEELRCDTNKGMNLLKFEVEVYKDNTKIDVGTLTNDEITIATTALDEASSSHMAKPEESVTIVDTVEYEGLKKGQEYKLIGTLMNPESGKAIENDGQAITSEVTFTPKKSTGSVKVKFTFHATALAGKSCVVFEDLYQNDTKLASHADLADTDQTIYFPKIKTSAKDTDTNSNISCADEEVTLVDTVSFQNLMPGEKYVVTGTLMDKETQKAVEVDGKPVTATAKLSPKDTSGTVDVTFTFNASGLKGKIVVVFESIIYKDKEVAVHADLTDAGQTIYFPEIKTSAKDKDTDAQQMANRKEATIIDIVEYSNLIADGREYRLTGTLMDKETQKPLEIDGKQVTAETTFIPEESSGSVELSFTFDGSALQGKTIVAFESVSMEEKEIAIHADIESESQSVYFPEVKTSARDKEDGDQEALADKEIIIIDTVTYKNLIADGKHTYKVKGVLMDKETKKALEIDGKQVIAEAEFVPDEPDGTMELSFTFDGSTLAGRDIVVFEKLFYVNGETEVEIASHEDIKDKDQTIRLTEVPKEETPTETPSVSTPVKTGDDTNMTPYIIVAVISGILLMSACGYLLMKRKKKKLDD